MENLSAIMPMLIVTLTAAATMVAEAARGKNERMPLAGLGLIGLVGAAVASMLLWNRNTTGFGVVRSDNFALFLNLVFLSVGLLTVLLSARSAERDGLPAGEYYTLMLFSLAGMMLMASATDLLVVFLALEVMSLAVYVLTGIKRTDAAGTEGAMKYFLLGAFSSAFFLYGIALAFAKAGSTRLDLVATAFAEGVGGGDPVTWAAIALLLTGFAFKVSAVPFHMWTPDAYEGAPTLVTGFMSTGIKAAAFAALLRVFVTAFGPQHAAWSEVLTWIAIATMIVGTVVGVVQANVKRMLAYSSIAHAGYLLVGVIVANELGSAAILFYLLAYAITNVGAFGVVALLATPERPNGDLRDFAGLWYSRPGLAAAMTVFLMSLGGFPPAAGFIGKWYIFTAAVQSEYWGLAIVGVLTSVVSVFYYLRIVVSMYMSQAHADFEPPSMGAFDLVAVSLATAGVLLLGILPTGVL
ncbi:MAG: NADH-quinone oxidoreductase subunit N, partial [Vicinamibacteraceae bacterium]|nr:NADH-quinone oxidoreductase subunit N [Vicinamibacteraceae bacterium]